MNQNKINQFVDVAVRRAVFSVVTAAVQAVPWNMK